MTPAHLAAPLTPDAEEARGWARDELSEPVYAEAEPGLLDRVVGWFLDRLSSLELPGGDGSGLWRLALLALVVVGVVVALVVVGRPRLTGRRSASADLFGGTSTTAAQHRESADAAAARSDWDEAVRERFRAVVRSLEERALLVVSPGRTADEAADEAGVLLAGVAADLRAGARLFDDVTYGSRSGTPDADARLRALDGDVAAARPDLGRDARVGLA